MSYVHCNTFSVDDVILHFLKKQRKKKKNTNDIKINKYMIYHSHSIIATPLIYPWSTQIRKNRHGV